MIQGLFKPQHNSIIKVYTLVNYKICIFLFQTILKQLTDMGFKETRAKKALFLNRCCIVVYSLVGKVLTNLQWLLRDFVTELLWYCKSWDTSRGKSCVQFKVESVSPSPNTNVCMEKLMFVSSEFTSGALLKQIMLLSGLQVDLITNKSQTVYSLTSPSDH